MARPVPLRPGDVRASRLGLILSRLGICAHDRLSERLEPLGLNARHFELLDLLSKNEGAAQQQLADAMGLHRNQMVKLLDDLENRGLVERRAHPRDRRAHALVLTPHAKELLHQAQAAAEADETDLTASLSADEARQLTQLLARVANHAGVEVNPQSPLDTTQRSDQPDAT